jgi:hypothetical protein
MNNSTAEVNYPRSTLEVVCPDASINNTFTAQTEVTLTPKLRSKLRPRNIPRVTTLGDFEEDKDKEGFLVPGSPLPAQAGESQGGTTIIIRPRSVRPSPPPVSLAPSSSPRARSLLGLPPFTAPPRVE